MLLLLLLFLLPASLGSAEKVPVNLPPEHIAVPTAQWEELRSNNSKLAQKLAMLEMQISTLKTPSNELMQQLLHAKVELQKSQQELMSVQTSLDNAKALQNEMQKSLQMLTEQMALERKAERRTQRHLRHQRNFWMALAGGTVIYCLSK